MNVPDHLKYTETHEWLLIQGDTATVGITDHAQAELTDVVFVDLPPVGKTAKKRDPIAVVESVKAASDIYAPVSGEIIETNPLASQKPALLNTSPYSEGWLFKIKISDPSQLDNLLSAEAYKSLIGA
jgi:glycine cleavage system H protein